MNYELTFPVIAAALYSLSVIFVKLSTAENKISPTSILVLNNVAMWLLFLPSLFFKGGIKDMMLIWQPILVGLFSPWQLRHVSLRPQGRGKLDDPDNGFENSYSSDSRQIYFGNGAAAFDGSRRNNMLHRRIHHGLFPKANIL